MEHELKEHSSRSLTKVKNRHTHTLSLCPIVSPTKKTTITYIVLAFLPFTSIFPLASAAASAAALAALFFSAFAIELLLLGPTKQTHTHYLSAP